MPDLTPEQLARQQIDAQLAACGWVVQDFRAVDFPAGRGIALREVPLTTGPCDYLLLVDRKALGVIEAKKVGSTLSTVAEQSGRYASSLPAFLASGLTGMLPFLYESTGIETLFRDQRDPAPRSRRVFTFHRPETLAGWATETDTLRSRLAQMPLAHPLATTSMRDCQIEAITGLERSFAEDRPRALIHMATGAGKTFTACAFTYRLIKYAKARRILFLVDRANLGEQARDEFHRYRTPDTNRLFTELYNVQHLTSPHIDDVCRVTICTIQRLYSILRGEELAEGADDLSGAELAAALGNSGSGVPPLSGVWPIEAGLGQGFPAAASRRCFLKTTSGGTPLLLWTSPTIPPSPSRSSISSSPTSAIAPSTISGGKCSNTSTPRSSASPPRLRRRPSPTSTRTASPNTTTSAPSPMA